MTDIEKLKELEARLRTYALAEDIFGQERRDLESAADLLASLASKDAEIERLNKRVMFWQGQAFEADLAAQAIEENTALKAELHGEARDARSNDSITGAWKAECEKQRERADKFMWQVRDTCARAEAAESRLTTALAALGEAREALEPFATAFDACTTGDGSCITSDEYRAMKTSVLPDHFRQARVTLAKLNAL